MSTPINKGTNGSRRKSWICLPEVRTIALSGKRDSRAGGEKGGTIYRLKGKNFVLKVIVVRNHTQKGGGWSFRPSQGVLEQGAPSNVQGGEGVPEMGDFL